MLKPYFDLQEEFVNQKGEPTNNEIIVFGALIHGEPNGTRENSIVRYRYAELLCTCIKLRNKVDVLNKRVQRLRTKKAHILCTKDRTFCKGLCSNCKDYISWGQSTNYCSNCGSKFVGTKIVEKLEK